MRLEAELVQHLVMERGKWHLSDGGRSLEGGLRTKGVCLEPVDERRRFGGWKFRRAKVRPWAVGLGGAWKERSLEHTLGLGSISGRWKHFPSQVRGGGREG